MGAAIASQRKYIDESESSSTVFRDKRTGKTKGYGYVSFSTLADLAASLKEMNGKYVGNRPKNLRKSSWKERTDQEAAKRQKRSPALLLALASGIHTRFSNGPYHLDARLVAVMVRDTWWI